MAEREIIKKYSNGELTVVWEPKKCIHSEICVKTLPEVYHPKEKPWIKPSNASTEMLKSQIDNCPSAALSYYMDGEEDAQKTSSSPDTKVDVMANGPLLVHGNLEVTSAGGKKEAKNRTTAFCRCGASNNKPYCDGAHKNIDFEG